MKYPALSIALALVSLPCVAADPVDQGHYRPQASLPDMASPARPPNDQKPFFDRKREGWFWYENPPREPKREDEHPKAPAPSESESASAALARIQKDLEESQARAVLDPTEVNVRAWLVYNRWMQSSAARFGEVAQKVLWQTPQLDNTVAQPVNQRALWAYREQQAQARETAVQASATTHALVFFLKGACPYCHAFAPVLAEFAQRTGFTVYPVSLDGGGLPEYPEPRVDPEAAARFNVEVVPAVFLVDPRTGDRQPLAFGVVSGEELAERLDALTRPAPPERPAALFSVRGPDVPPIPPNP